MSFDFPSNPTSGQIINNSTSGASFQWDGVKWGPVQSASNWVDAPADGNTYGRKNNTWNSVDAMVAPALNDTGRNLLHNPVFTIAQRGTGPWTAPGYTLDRWGASVGTDTFSVSQQTFATGSAVVNDESAIYCLTNVFTGNSAAGAFTTVYQTIEDVRRLSNKTVTLSFWATASSGTPRLGASIDQYFGTGGSPSTAVNNPGQSVQLSTTWTRYVLTYTLASIAGKTLGTNNNSGTTLYLWYSSGSNFATRAGNIGVQAATISIWGVQLEIGSVASPLAKRDPADDFALCQRFYQIVDVNIGSVQASAGTIGYTIPFLVQMRAAPTITVTGTSYTNASGLQTSASTGRNAAVWASVTTSGYASFTSTLQLSADL